MIRKIRITLASLMYLGLTLLFLDITGVLHSYLGWMAKIQFIPAIIALNVAVIVGIIVLTAAFGRIYCSVICPLGIMQDIIANLGARWRNRGKKSANNRGYGFSSPKTLIRIAFLAIFLIALLSRFTALASFIAPYSTWGRITANLVSPIYLAFNNVFAWISEAVDSYGFYEKEIWIKSLPTFFVAAASFIIIAVLSWRNGRTYCNTVCPVGTLLGFLSRFSVLKVRIDAEKCKNCNLCAKNCKSACIDINNHTVDHSRCVVCGNCMQQCKFGALKYASPKSVAKPDTNQKTENSRRAFLFGAAIATASAAIAQEKKKVDGGMAAIKDKINPERKLPINPPGSISAENMAQHCTACQLCVQACPNGVLVPSTNPATFMQPTLSYTDSHCRPECNICSDVCPAGAIKPITVEQKASLKIGQAVWIKKNCVVLTDEVECGNCARHCPASAIEMIPMNAYDESSPKIPVIDSEKCIGCGACEHLCPARPFSAIIVNGIDKQHEV